MQNPMIVVKWINQVIAKYDIEYALNPLSMTIVFPLGCAEKAGYVLDLVRSLHIS